jgi:hypothetical protein
MPVPNYTIPDPSTFSMPIPPPDDEFAMSEAPLVDEAMLDPIFSGTSEFTIPVPPPDDEFAMPEPPLPVDDSTMPDPPTNNTF